MAGASVMSDTQYAFRQSEEFVGDRMTSPDTSVIMAMFKDARPVEVAGRGLVHYWGSQTRGHGSSGYVAENGDFPAPGRAVTQQNSVTCRLGVMSVELSDHQVQQLAAGTSEQNGKTMAKILRDEVARQRQRILADLFTRDDSVKARCAAEVSAASAVYSSIPIRFVVGDKVYSYPAPGTNDERLLTGTPVTTATYVNHIETDMTDVAAGYTGGKVTLSAAVTYADDSVLVLAGAALATSVLGIENHFDTVNDASFQWDSDDGGTVDHGQETSANPYYAGLQRSTYPNLNCQTINANGNALSLNYLTRAAQKCIQQGGQEVADKLMVIMNPLQYDRFLVTEQGKTERANTVQINGVDFELPIIATGTAKRLAVVTTPMWKDGVVGVFPNDCLGKAFKAVGWDEDGMHRQTASSGSGYSASRINYWEYFFNSFCDMPFYACLVYGLNTDNV